MTSIAQALANSRDSFTTGVVDRDTVKQRQAIFPMFEKFAQILDQREQKTLSDTAKRSFHTPRKKHLSNDFEQGLEGLKDFITRKGISIKEPSRFMKTLGFSPSLHSDDQLMVALNVLEITIPKLKFSLLEESLVQLLTKGIFPIEKFNKFLTDLYSKLDLNEAEPLTVDCPKMKQYTNPPPRNTNIYPAHYRSRFSHPENIALLDQAFTFLNELKAKSLMLETLANEASEV